MANMDIRFKAKAAGVPFWKIAEKLGVTEVTITRRFRKELNPEQKQMYLDIIQQIVIERAKADMEKVKEDL